MIYVYWPPGCYGSYVMYCIYAYSDLSKGVNKKFLLSDSGNYHQFRDSKECKKYFIGSHEYVDFYKNTIIVNPCKKNNLDYLNNQLVKQENNKIVKSLQKSFPDAWHNDFLKNWNTTDLWALREWASFWLPANMESAYNEKKNAHLDTNDLFNTTENIFYKLITLLGLTVRVSDTTIETNQQRWIKNQKYHCSQNNCENYVKKILEDKNVSSPCQTLLDEAYVQFLLRIKGYELKCDGLNYFPKNSLELQRLIV